MAKSRKQQKLEAKNKAQEKQFWKVTIIVCAILLVILGFIFLSK